MSDLNKIEDSNPSKFESETKDKKTIKIKKDQFNKIAKNA